ncbi:bacteriocin immunity protein [Enterovibrio gelatinilyticus]|nr:bacteriocin immunity protein [Enterovibrio sp. ZSDZ42]
MVVRLLAKIFKSDTSTEKEDSTPESIVRIVKEWRASQGLSGFTQ